MIAYCGEVRELLQSFEQYSIQQILHSQNSHADALARLESPKDAKLLKVIPIEFLVEHSINS